MTNVSERRYIEVPYRRAGAALERRLGFLPRQGSARCVLVLVAPLSDGREMTRDVTATTTRSPGSTNLNSSYHITWEAGPSTHGIPTPGFDGTLTLCVGEDYDESRLQLDGCYEAPGGVAGKLFDDVAGRRLAHATLGVLLDGIGDGLRVVHERTEAAKHRI